MRKKIILSQIFFIPIIIFFINFGKEVFTNANREYGDLTFVNGRVTKIDSTTHLDLPDRAGVRKKHKIFIFQIENNNTIFGIMDENSIYESSRKHLLKNKNSIVELYYDKTGEEILKGLTLHIVELKIDNIKEKTLKEGKKKDMVLSIILFLIASGFTTADILLIKAILKKHKD